MAPEPHKPTLLVVDDETGPRDALKVILRPFFDLHLVDTGQGALRILREQRIDLVTLDLKLPDRSGVDLLQEIKLEYPAVEVVIITGYGSLKSAMDGIRYGAAGYLLKPFNVMELITLVNQTLQKKQRLDRLREFLHSSVGHSDSVPNLSAAWELYGHLYTAPAQPDQMLSQKPGQCSELTSFLSDVLEAKSRDLFNHSSRVSFFATRLGKHLDLTAAERRALAIGAFLHDVGKLASEERGWPSDRASSEQTISDHHPEIGPRMIRPLGLPAEVSQIVAYHHEHYDGSGSPEGLQGEGIPLLARIVGIAQAFDHMVNHPVHHHSVSPDEAMSQIRSRAGSHFDPALVDLFARVVGECKASLPSFATSFGPAIPSEP
jgi:putative nucleotidyltransferase with HDIG domain